MQDAINSASSITQNLTTELIDGQRKLLGLFAAGNTKALDPLAVQQANGPSVGLPEMVKHQFQVPFSNSYIETYICVVNHPPL